VHRCAEASAARNSGEVMIAISGLSALSARCWAATIASAARICASKLAGEAASSWVFAEVAVSRAEVKFPIKVCFAGLRQEWS
jgi:hypothetical protein